MLFFEQQLRRVIGVDVLFGGDHQVDFTAHQHLDRQLSGAHQFESDMRRLQVDALDDFGEQHVDQVVGGHDAKVSLALRDVEHGLGGDGSLDLEQHLAHRDLQVLAQQSGRHGAPDLYQQVVFEVGTQAPQDAAQRGLRHVQADRRAGDVLLFEQYIQGDEQVQIQMVEAHGGGLFVVFIFEILSMATPD